MSTLWFYRLLAPIGLLALSSAPALAGYLDPCPAPLPELGATLFGQVAAGVLGWRLYRGRRGRATTRV